MFIIIYLFEDVDDMKSKNYMGLGPETLKNIAIAFFSSLPETERHAIISQFYHRPCKANRLRNDDNAYRYDLDIQLDNEEKKQLLTR